MQSKSHLKLRDCPKLSKDFEKALDRCSELGIQHRRTWAQGVKDGDQEALYAAVAFLCHNVQSLRLDLTYVKNGECFEILGHLASIPLLQSGRSVYYRLFQLVLTDTSEKSQSKAENSARARRLTPLAFIHGIQDVVLHKFDIEPMSNHALRSSIAGSAITNPHQALSAHTVRVQVFDLMDGKRQNKRDLLYRGLRDWISRFPELQKVNLDLRSNVLCRPLQVLLNAHRSSLVRLDLMRSCPTAQPALDHSKHLSFNSFPRIKSLKVYMELMYPDITSILRHGDANAVEIILSRPPKTLEHLNLSLSTAKLGVCAKLIAFIIESGRIPNMKAVETDFLGQVDTHFRHPWDPAMYLLPYLVPGSPYWDFVAKRLWQNVQGHVTIMFNRWEGIKGQGIQLTATLSEIARRPDFTPYSIYPSEDTQMEITARVVGDLMEGLRTIRRRQL